MRFKYVIIGLFLISLTSCDETKTKAEEIKEMEDSAKQLEDGESNSAIEFNDGLIGLQGRVLQYVIDIGNEEDPAEIKKLSGEGKAECQDVLASLKTIDIYPGGERMTKAMIAAMEVYEVTFGRLERMMELSLLEEPTEADEAEYEELSALLDQNTDAADLEFEAAQNEFARKNGFVLTENPLDEDFNEAYPEDEE